MLVGLISDTHGLVRRQALAALRGVDLILHAGDVGRTAVLDELAHVAPVRAVRGNVDDPFDETLADELVLELAGHSVRVTHGHELGSPAPDRLLAVYPEDVIVCGHTHVALAHREGKRLVVNPGSAGPRRFCLVPGVALLRLRAGVPPDVRLIRFA